MKQEEEDSQQLYTKSISNSWQLIGRLLIHRADWVPTKRTEYPFNYSIHRHFHSSYPNPAAIDTLHGTGEKTGRAVGR